MWVLPAIRGAPAVQIAIARAVAASTQTISKLVWKSAFRLGTDGYHIIKGT